MKARHFPIGFLLLLIVTYVHSSAQSIKDGFVSGEGNFFLAIQGEPVERQRTTISLGKFLLHGESIVWRDEMGTFTSVEHYYVEREKPNLMHAEKAAIIESYKKTALQQFSELKIEASEFPYSFDGTNGIEIRGAAAARLLVRTFFGRNRLYSISNVRRTAGYDEHTSMLNTFRLLSKAEQTDALVSENTPERFARPDKIRQVENDLKAEGLKGEIKRIKTEFQESSRSKRILWSDEYFDVEGNLEAEVAYNEGYPDSISTMGWLDGMRVYRTNYISYPFGEGPNEKVIMTLDEPPPSADSGPEAESDNRYDSRYERTYDDENRLHIEKVVSNTGELLTFKTFSYQPNKKEIIYRISNGAFYNKTIQLFGKNGQIIEETSCDESGRKCDATVFEYEFDSTGNWIVKKESEKKLIRGKVSLKPSGIFYRKIEYYEP